MSNYDEEFAGLHHEVLTEQLDVPFDPVKALEMERTVNPGESLKQTTLRIMKEAGPAAVLSVIHLSRHAKNESVRLNAAAMVIDRNLGKVASQEWMETHDTDSKNPWDGLLADSIRSEDAAIERAHIYSNEE